MNFFRNVFPNLSKFQSNGKILSLCKDPQISNCISKTLVKRWSSSWTKVNRQKKVFVSKPNKKFCFSSKKLKKFRERGFHWTILIGFNVSECPLFDSDHQKSEFLQYQSKKLILICFLLMLQIRTQIIHFEPDLKLLTCKFV